MQTYIAMLRGINVSGHKMIKMEALRTLCESLGCKNVKTYIQSGNIVFQYKKAGRAELEKKIAKKILQEFGFEVPVLVMELEAVKEAASLNPFVNKRKEDIAFLHVTFLSGEPNTEAVDKIKAGAYGNDSFVVSGRHIYLFCPGGYGNTKLNNNFFENKLKLVATTRNWKTVNELVKMAEAIPTP